jgi:putative peptide zinc metalloprotease protein
MTHQVRRLRNDVSIRPFDAIDTCARYVIAVDDRHFVVNEAVAALLEATRDGGDTVSVSRRVSGILGRVVTAAQVERVLEEQLPECLFSAGQGQSASSPVRGRVLLLRAEHLAPALAVMGRLFTRERVWASMACFLCFEALLAWQLWHAGPEANAGASPFGVIALVILGMLLHEFGHLGACHRFGARHGGIGVGFYWLIPAFYAEVHGAWLLTRRQRAVVDAGGVYFQCLFLSLLSALYLWRPSPTVLMAIACTHLLVLNTLNPVLKFDGYWLLSDLTGSHNLHVRIREAACLWWRRISGASPTARLSRMQMLLVTSFGLLAAAYFSYVFFFLGLHLARASAAANAALQQSAAWWVIGLRSLWLAILGSLSFGIACMVARAVRGIISGVSFESIRKTTETSDALA